MSESLCWACFEYTTPWHGGRVHAGHGQGSEALLSLGHGCVKIKRSITRLRHEECKAIKEATLTQGAEQGDAGVGTRTFFLQSGTDQDLPQYWGSPMLWQTSFFNQELTEIFPNAEAVQCSDDLGKLPKLCRSALLHQDPTFFPWSPLHLLCAWPA